MKQRDLAGRQLEVADWTRGGIHARLRAGLAGDRDENLPERDRAVPSRHEALHTMGYEERDLSGRERDRFAHRSGQPQHATFVLVHC